MIETAPNITYSMRSRFRVLELIQDQLGQIVWMKGIPHLQSFAAKTDVTQRSPGSPGVQPEGKDALFSGAKLAGSGEDAAAVDPDRKPECVAVFQSQGFRSKLGCSIQRNRSGGAELFIDAGGRNSREFNS